MEPQSPRPRSFPKVENAYNFPKLEERILQFWEDEGIFEKSIDKPAPRGSFVFYEGPPTANNLPHIGHVLTRVVKDLFPRYRTMRGYKVNRKAGWDTHGLPVELAIEKKLGFEGKEAIERYGVAEFNKQCFDNVRTYEREWAKTSKRIGYWLNYDDAYFTFTNPYIESVWWLLSQMQGRGLLYQGYKVLPYCPLCGTTLSSHEVAQGYQDVKDPSVYIKLRVRNGQALKGSDGSTLTADGKLFLAAWTTTPWTLPSNVALAVHPDFTYKVVASRAHPGEKYVIADGLEVPVEEPITGADGKPSSWDMRTGEALLTLTGRDLQGVEYERLFDYAGEVAEKGWYVVTADYVTRCDGTGIVHQAPAYGQDDYLVSREYNLPFVVMVNNKGVFVDAATPFKGMWFKDADPEIIADLKHRGLLIRSQRFEHAYPHCWRHDTPLFYFATASWFIKTTAVKDELIANNQKINWMPNHIKDGRFGNWLENVVDWAISRKRYWGTPLPVWRCDACERIQAIASYQELFQASGRAMPADVYDQTQFNPHRPYIDDFTWACGAGGAGGCHGTMKRVEEVIDCWFDAGAMPFAQHHYPFENKERIDSGEQFPADFISEAIDQTRGWFYTLHVISTLMKAQPAYKNCIVVGHVQDEQGRKMSKRLGNVVDPWTSINALGADTVRWYFYSSMTLGQSARFSERLVREGAKGFLLPLWNAYSFFTIYANIDGWTPDAPEVPFADRDPLDRWILTKLNRLNAQLIDDLDNYRMQESTQAVQTFVDHLNNWYIRRSRRRFWSGESDATKQSAYQTLHHVLATLARLVAPFTPFVAEELYQALERPFAGPDAPESVHLADYPEPRTGHIDQVVEKAMDQALRAVTLGHAARNLSQVRVRQPLARMTLITLDQSMQAEIAPYQDIILDELNVKSLDWTDNRDEYVTYSVKPNFRKLGPRFGKDMPRVKAAVEAVNPALLATQLEHDGAATVPFDGREEKFTAEELDVSIQQKEGTATASDDSLLVVLDTRVSHELRQEGLAREIINRIQGLRKDGDLEYTARIRVTVDVIGPLREAIEANRETIMEETLAVSLELGSLAEGGARVEEDLDGESLKLRMEVVGQAE